jgi:hypothetical protein
MSSSDSWVWLHFKKPKSKGEKAICQVPKADGAPCGAGIAWLSGTTSLGYHLTSVHKLERGAPSKRQKTLKWGTTIGTSPSFPLNDKELLCVTWASNGLSYELIEDTLFRRAFASCIPRAMDRQILSEEMTKLAERCC